MLFAKKPRGERKNNVSAPSLNVLKESKVDWNDTTDTQGKEPA